MFEKRIGESSPPAILDVAGLVQCRLATGQYDDARRLLDGLDDGVKKDARIQYAIAQLRSVTGEYEEAIEACRRAIRSDRRHAPARLLLAQTLERVGEAEEALRTYAWFDRIVTTQLPEDAENLTAVGLGFYRFSVLTEHANLVHRTRHVLNKIFQVAFERLDRTYYPGRIASGDLLREKYNEDDARTEYQAALDINARAVDALVGLGWLEFEHWSFEAIDEHVDEALAINPRHPGALRLMAATRILERRYADAVAACEQALAINPRDVEALGLSASAKRAMYDHTGVKQITARVRAINPKCSVYHRILGETLSGLRQYAESEKHFEASIAFEPSAPLPRIQLGLMYMQWGDEKKARDALDAAWRLDPFNEKTKNTLELLDRMEKFSALETEHFIIRYDANHDALVAPLVAEHLESVYPMVCDDYGADLSRKTIIEVFPNHSDFGVRITGKPWIHTVGVCTGWVIAIDSPRSGPDSMGPFDLAGVLTHEFAHTVTLAVTENRIPHWMTEGLAVLAEQGPRSFSWMQLLAQAIRKDELFTLSTIDWGFARPKQPWHRPMAYAQSEWMCEYLIETRGYDIIESMLTAFRDGLSQKETFEKVVGVSESKFDRQFAQWAKRQASGWGMDLSPVQDPEPLRKRVALEKLDPELWAQLAKAEYDAGNLEAAVESARFCRSISKKDGAEVLRTLVRALFDQSETISDKSERGALLDEALPVGEKLIELAPDDPVGLKIVATIYLERDFVDLAQEHLIHLHRVQPHDPFAASRLAGIYLLRGDDRSALPYLLEVARKDENDVTIRVRISDIYTRSEKLEESRYWLMRSLMIDPYSVIVRQKFAEVLTRMGRAAEAVRQYEILCELEPHVAEHWTRAALTFHQMGRADDAVRCAKRAVQLDAQSPAAGLLD